MRNESKEELSGISPIGEKVLLRRSLRLATSVSSFALDFLSSLSTLLRGPLTFNSNFQTFEALKALTFFPFFVLPWSRGRDENGRPHGETPIADRMIKDKGLLKEIKCVALCQCHVLYFLCKKYL